MPLLLFMLIPIVEMWILIEVGGWIGALPTIGLVVLTATIGLSLLKQQGLSTLMRARRKMDEGAIPASELVSGVMIAVGGALLLTPGFVTDALGFALLIPQTRQWLLFKLIDRYRDKIVIEVNSIASMIEIFSSTVEKNKSVRINRVVLWTGSPWRLTPHR